MKKLVLILIFFMLLIPNIILIIQYPSLEQSNFIKKPDVWILSTITTMFFIYILYNLFKKSQLAPMIIDTKEQSTNSQNHKNITFKDVAGLEEVIEELQDIIDYLKNPEKYFKMGAKLPRGIIFYGPPGTGKTLLATAIAGETNATFIPSCGSEFVEKYVGVGASRIRALFAKAKKCAPSIIFIDEIDAVGSKRNIDNNSEKDQTLNQLLVEMDGFGEKEPIVVIGATNRLDLLDEALLRPGRFDRQIYIGNPGLKAREEILKVHTRQKPLHPSVKIEEIAKKTHGMSGAHLAILANEAAILAVRHNKNVIGKEEFDMALEKILTGLRLKNAVVTEFEKKMVAFHEAGHALIGKLLKINTIEKISIVPRGQSLGFVMNLPKEDRFIMTKSELLNKITMLMGGRAAEELIFNDISTGAHGDLKEATEIATQMVCNFGMSELGNRIFNNEIKNHDLINREIDKIIKECHQKALRLIKDNIGLLYKIAEKLLEKETIDGEELDKIIA